MNKLCTDATIDRYILSHFFRSNFKKPISFWPHIVTAESVQTETGAIFINQNVGKNR